MGTKNQPSAETLGQIALIQSMVANLPDKENMLRFVCRGLHEVPGVNKVNYRMDNEGVIEKRSSAENQESLQEFMITSEGYDHGELLIYVSDVDSFSPYVPFIKNLSNMLAVIFEERRQRSMNQSLLAELEKRVYERTEELEVEVKKHRQAEEALRESEENLRITLNSIGDAVISTDTDGNITRMNLVAEALTGWERNEASGQSLSDVFFIVDAQTQKPIENPVARVLKAGKIVGLSKPSILVAKDGTKYQITDSGAPIRDAEGNVTGVVLVFRDVSEQQRIEQELLKVKKLESVGILAGGIAHDFNNLLTGIFCNMEMARMLLPADHKAYKYLDLAERSMDSAINLTKQLLTFAKGGDPIKKTLSIAQVIIDMAQFSLRGSKAKLQISIAPDLWLVEADKGQLSQVISNLVINAEQAMPTGGIITIIAKNVETSAGRTIQITVQDEGVGIAPQYVDEIFDPYFTTKQIGSGLGLATTHSIVSKHNGQITVDSQLNQGTTFTISLPAVDKMAEEIVEEPPAEADTADTSSARILVIDDEELVRAVIGAMLESMGYDVIFTNDGREAIEKYRAASKNGVPYDVVITDLTIPGGMGGREAAQELLDIDPQAKIIVSSGYATDPVMANYQAYGFRGVAVKPYRFAELQKVVQQVLKMA